MPSRYEKIYLNWLDHSAVDDTPKGGIVYHYTNALGLIGILEHGEIFATDHRFLNDKSELTHGLGAATDLCRRLSQRTNDRRLARFLDEIVHCLGIQSEVRSFVASFSERPDDLSQWRGYAQDGEGFTIGLDATSLLAKSNQHRFGFAKVNYSKAEFDTQISTLVKHFYSALPDSSEAEREVVESADWCDVAVETLCPFFKHSSFLSEREWRIIDHVADEDDNRQIMVRARGNSLVPYIKIDLKDDDGRIPLSSIGVGPTFSNPATSQVVRDLCTSMGYDPKIYNAKTPYQRV